VDESACSWSSSLHDTQTHEVSLPHPLSFFPQTPLPEN